MIWLTANQNFGRHSSIELWQRPFKNVEEMNAALVKAWNKTVAKNDTVWVLGDFAWDPETANEMLKKLNGTIKLIKGTYDLPSLNLIHKDSIYLNGLYQQKFKDKTYTFSYWPQCEWQGELSFIGYPEFDKYPTNMELGRINVACDKWSFKPVSLEKMIDLAQNLKKEA